MLIFRYLFYLQLTIKYSTSLSILGILGKTLGTFFRVYIAYAPRLVDRDVYFENDHMHFDDIYGRNVFFSDFPDKMMGLHCIYEEHSTVRSCNIRRASVVSYIEILIM